MFVGYNHNHWTFLESHYVGLCIIVVVCCVFFALLDLTQSKQMILMNVNIISIAYYLGLWFINSYIGIL